MKQSRDVSYPLYYEKIEYCEPKELIKLFSHKKDLSLLISSSLGEQGRYSYLCFDSFAQFKTKQKQGWWNDTLVSFDNPFDFIQEKLTLYRINQEPHLPPLQGGAVGYFAYEAKHYVENAAYIKDLIQMPDIHLNFYANIIAIDHQTQQTWILATGFPAEQETARKENALSTIAKLKTVIKKRAKNPLPQKKDNYSVTIHSNFARHQYIDTINQVKAYIAKGDIFQANVSQQFSGQLPSHFNPLKLYCFLMQQSPSSFSAFLRLKEGHILSTSPERFLKVSNKHVETCPIKGTRKRVQDPTADKALAQALIESEKDKAENIMIVDLMRNDLARVCLAGTVKVEELCHLKSFAHVHHLVSKITGQLAPHLTALDLLQASFPPGSITGAPKVRAMEIISEVERQSRGPYCGTLGYFSFTGDMDTAVTIRTFFTHNQRFFFSSGGAVVLDSNPNEEFLESLIKSKTFFKVFGHDLFEVFSHDFTD